MNQIKGCIFDLDGVVVDTAKYHYLAWKKLAEELGFKFTKEDNERLKGVSRMDSLDILLQIGNMDTRFSKEEKEALAAKKNSWYVDFISKMDKSEILPGVEDFIIELKRNNIKICLGSVSKNAMTILNRIEITKYFDGIIDGNKVSKAKPDPEVFLKGSAEIGIAPEYCTVFEDAVAGVEAAKRAGMHCIGIGSNKILSNADKVIPDFKNITLDILSF